MKKRYLILLSIIAVEFFAMSILKNNIKVQSWIGNAIGILIFFLPIQILLILLSKDDAITEKKKKFCKVAFLYISICYILGGISLLIF